MNYHYLYIAALVFVVACQQSSKDHITPEGYKYIMYEDVKGDIPEKGNFVSFEMDILDSNGELLQSYRNTPTTPSLQIPNEEPNSAAPPNPIVGVLSMVSTGDSLGLIIPLDSIKTAPPQYAELEYLEYRIKVKDILSQEEYIARAEQERQERKLEADAAKARESEIASFVEETRSDYLSGKLDDQIETTESGLKYIVHEEGGKKSEVGKVVSVHYYGILPTDGTMFDNSFKRGNPYTFTLGRGEVIQAWDLGIALLGEGAKATIISPPELAYGEGGNPPIIPANAELMFYVEIDKVFN